jgi:hypothetical protein
MSLFCEDKPILPGAAYASGIFCEAYFKAYFASLFCEEPFDEELFCEGYHLLG